MRVVQHGNTGSALDAARTTRHLPNDLAGNWKALSGELESVRFATILFADIVGSTRLISALDPEDARDLLDSSIALIQQAIHEFDGLVVRVQGDGVMAVFGIHPAAQDHALRASVAARRIVDRMKSGAVGILPSPQVRVGLHAGPILLRRQDNDFGSIVDVVGHAAHVAGQIEKLAPPGSVAISAATVSLIAEHCELRPLGTLPGNDDSAGSNATGETVFELLAVDFAGSDSVPVKGNATYPVIGRHDDVERLRVVVAASRQGQAAALGFVGEAGMGKSRLLLEGSRIAAGLGVTVVVIRGNALIAAVPFGCLAPAIRHLVDLLRPFCPDPAAAAALTAEQAECLSGIVASKDSWLPGLTPGDRNRIARQTVIALARLAVANLPLLVLVDDVQYIDKETLGVLASIRKGANLAMIAGGRPEAARRISMLCGRPVHLDALSPGAARVLVSMINRHDPLDDATVENIIERAEGLPLAVQEFAVAAQPDAGIARLPARLENLLAERLAALDEDATRLCQLCAALGPSFPANRLARGAALVCRNPANALARLVEARVIETAQGDVARFTHQLVQEAAYGTMARRRRTAMHARVLELLEDDATAPAELASQAELATHAEKAGLTQRALEHLWQACEQALGLAAIESVLVLYRHAREVAKKLDPRSAAFERARFSLLAFDTLQQLSLEQEAREDILAVASGQIDMGPTMRTVARINMALLDWIDGAPARGAIWLAEAEADLDLRESLPRRTFADLVAAYIAYSRADPEAAIARIERLGARLDDGSRGSTFGAVVVIPHVLARSFGAWYLVDLGDVPRARQWIAEALNLSRRYRHKYSRLLADLANGYQHYRSGRIDRALHVLRTAYADCLRYRFHGFEPVSTSWLALCLIEQGLLEEAGTVLADSVRRGHYRHVRTAATYYFHEARTRLAMARGDAAEATARAAEALTHCRDCGEAMHELHAAVLGAEVRAAFGEDPQVPDALRTKVKALGIAPLIRRLDALASLA